MKFSWKSAVTLSVLSAATIVPVLGLADSASAQLARGMNGNYVGAGVAVGVTSPDDDTTFGGNVQGRYDVPLAPVSLRGSVLFNDEGAALMPIVSYDVGVAPNTNVYLGTGYSFVTDNGSATPLGDKNAPVLTAGVETAVTRNIALYGDAKLGIDAYEGSSDAAVSLQVGAAYRF
jgi:outer membrane autotransporter protein